MYKYFKLVIFYYIILVKYILNEMFTSEIVITYYSAKHMSRKPVFSNQIAIIHKMLKLRFCW